MITIEQILTISNKKFKTNVDIEITHLWQFFLKNLKLQINYNLLRDVVYELKNITKKYLDQVNEYFNWMREKLKYVEWFRRYLIYCIFTKSVSIERTKLMTSLVIEYEGKRSYDKLKYMLKLAGCGYVEEAINQIRAVNNNILILYEIAWSNELATKKRTRFRRLIPGIGLKRSSLMLREITEDVIPIDIHVFKYLEKLGIVKGNGTKAKTMLIAVNYFKIENVIREIAKTLGLSAGKLDLVLFLEDSGYRIEDLKKGIEEIFRIPH